MAFTFKSSRISTGNAIFPITIVIDDNNFYCYKGQLLGSTRVAIARRDIASVGVRSGILFSDVVIETRGGSIYCLNGFSHSDARKIMSVLRVES